MTLRTWQACLLLLAIAAPLAAQTSAPNFAAKMAAQKGVNPALVAIKPQVAPGVMQAPAQCSPAAIRTAYDHNVAPALKGCSYAAVAPYLKEFFKPTPHEVDQSDPSNVGIVVGQDPDPAQSIGDKGLTVNVGAIVDQGTTGTTNTTETTNTISGTDSGKKGDKPPRIITDPPSTQTDTGSTRLPGDTSTIYPWWFWPAAIGLVIVAIIGLGWLIVPKPPIDDIVVAKTDPVRVEVRAPVSVTTPVLPTIGCAMEASRVHLNALGPLAEGPHLTIAMAFDAGPPRISAVAVVLKEILP